MRTRRALRVLGLALAVIGVYRARQSGFQLKDVATVVSSVRNYLQYSLALIQGQVKSMF